MIKISELKERDVLKTKYNTLTVLQNLGKVVVVEYEDMTTQIFSEKELNNHNYQLVPPTPEINKAWSPKVGETVLIVKEYKESVSDLTKTNDGKLAKFLGRTNNITCPYIVSVNGKEVHVHRIERYKSEKSEVPPTPEKKYYMGFEVREYPERPIVQVGAQKCLRRLIEVKENYVVCENEAKGASPVNWDYVYRIPETKIVEPTSSGTREGDGC